MNALAVIALFALALIDPLTPAQRERLSLAYDRRDHQEEAFAALVENVRGWTGAAGDEPIRLHPNFEALLADPGSFRGDLCRIGGRLEQQTPLGSPYTDIMEWFVRDASDRPVIVYVIRPNEQRSFERGTRVEIDARFYKRIDAAARDGQPHQYAAFVGRFPRLLVAESSPAGDRRLVVIASLIAIMLCVFVLLMMLAQRRGKRTRESILHSRLDGPADPSPTPPPEDLDLPDDPAQALAELKRRAGP